MEYEIGIRLREARKKLSLTQMEFGKKIGVSDVTISTTESGKTPLTEANIKLICLTFNLNENWLRTGVGQMLNETTNNPEELSMIQLFDQLSPEGRKMANEYLQFLLKNERKLEVQDVTAKANLGKVELTQSIPQMDPHPSELIAGEKGTHPIHEQDRA